MKKILLSLLIAISGYYCYAQTNTFPSSGNVGIGTTNPSYTLDVVGQTATNYGNIGTRFIGSGTDFGIKITNTGGGSTDWNILSTGIGSGLGVGKFAIANATTLKTPFIIDANGNIGIGTTTPAGNLDINGRASGVGSHVATSMMLGTVNGGAGAISDGLTIMRAGSGGVVTPALKLANYFTANASQDVVAIDFVGGDGNGAFGTPLGRIAVETSDIAAYMGFSVNNAERLRIDNSGNVGIGTMQPDQKLTVNGTIHSTEVKVTPTVPVPDYVFEKTYQLINLTELKSYLAANHHLPEIPSAVEIEKNGLNLSAMNLKLLKKVEELTLYIINEDKQLSDQQKEIDELKTQLKAIIQLIPKH